MTLNLYRRHGTNCPGGRAFDSRSYEADELRRGWKNCSCPIYVCGTLNRQFKRKNTEQLTWPEAKTRVAVWEGAGSWTGEKKSHALLVAADVPSLVPPPPTDPSRKTIANALRSYLMSRESSGIAPPTLRKYRTFTKHIADFATARGYVMLDQLTSSDIDLLYKDWKLGVRTKAHALGHLRSFFRFCVNRDWLVKSPVASDLKAPIGSSRVANKIPFTDEELNRIIRACDQMEPVSWSNGRQQGVWTGGDTKDFIWLLVYTGLRISDASLFEMGNLRGNELFLRAKKNGGDVFTWIPDWLRDRLQELRRKRGNRPFVVGSSDRLETVTDLWRRKINRVFQLAGKFSESPTPHRFRHTFARILLQRGVPVADVADLLGDDEETVRRHYSRWVPERQARLTNILREAFDDRLKVRPRELERRSA